MTGFSVAAEPRWYQLIPTLGLFIAVAFFERGPTVDLACQWRSGLMGFSVRAEPRWHQV